MIIEIEKRYNLTKNDYNTIKQKCIFISEKKIIDLYLDSIDYKIFNSNYKVRIRNNKPELKIKFYDKNKKVNKYFEYNNLDEINFELKKLGLNFSDLKEVLNVTANREKYQYNYKGIDFTIDIDKYKYGERYEIEICFQDDTGIDGEKLINDFRKYLGLNSKENFGIGKVGIFAKNDNFKIFKIIENNEKKLN